MNKVLIIGKVPPPIGGVTIHVKRLCEHLDKNNIEYCFIALTLFNILLIPFYVISYKVVHLHTSNLQLQYFFSILCRFLNKKSIITFHGDLGRYPENKKDILKKCIKNIAIPIVLNEGSYKFAVKLNKNTQLISAFLPPLSSDKLKPEVSTLIKDLLKKYYRVYTSNAYDVTYDKDGVEIYGIVELIDYFNSCKDIALVILDPSGNYQRKVVEENIKINGNIIIIGGNNSFYEVLKLVDGSIRNTSTDGDSLSIHESLSLSKVTFATDVVSRPEGTITYRRGEYFFEDKIFEKPIIKGTKNIESINKLIKLYQ